MRLKRRPKYGWIIRVFCFASNLLTKPNALAGFGLPLHNLASASLLLCVSVYYLPPARLAALLSPGVFAQPSPAPPAAAAAQPDACSSALRRRDNNPTPPPPTSLWDWS